MNRTKTFEIRTPTASFGIGPGTRFLRLTDAFRGVFSARLFCGDEEEVVTPLGDGTYAVVVHADRGCQVVVFAEKFATVEAVEQVVGDLQHPAGEPVLEVEGVEARDALHAAAVFLVIGCDLLVPEDPERFDPGETTPEELPQLFGGVFADVPGIACERHRGIGRGDDKAASGSQHAVDFAYELPVVADVLDDLERDYAVERRLGKLYRGDDGLAEFDIGPCEQFVCGSVLVEGDEPPGMRGHDLDSVSGPGSDFEHVARGENARMQRSGCTSTGAAMAMRSESCILLPSFP